MKKARYIALIAAAVLVICMVTGCGSSGDAAKSTATAKQVVGDKQEALMTVDLTGGYCVEFASGAAYFYKGEPSDENEVIAFGYVLTKKEYDEEVAYITSDKVEADEVKDLGDGVYSYGTDFFFPTEDGFYMKVAVQEAGADEADSIYPRFSARASEW